MTFPMNAPMFDLLVLAIAAEEDAYGYQISQVVKTVANTKDSTLYPVLKRLQEQGFLSVYDQLFQGRNRRYYRITDSGREHYRMLAKEWDSYKASVDRIVKGGVQSEQGRIHEKPCPEA